MFKKFVNAIYWWPYSASFNLVSTFMLAWATVVSFYDGEYGWAAGYFAVAFYAMTQFESQESKGNIWSRNAKK